MTENTSHTAQYDGSTSDNQPKDSGDLHPSDDQKPTSLGLMYGLSAGHGIKHFGQGALLVMIPSIRATLGLSDVAVGGMSSAQSQIFLLAFLRICFVKKLRGFFLPR